MNDYRTVPVPEPLVRFLLGEGEWNGRDFGDEPPAKAGYRQPYWWRTDLRAALSASPAPAGDLVERAAKKAAHAAHRFKGGRWNEDPLWKAMGEPERESHRVAARAVIAAMQPGWRDMESADGRKVRVSEAGEVSVDGRVLRQSVSDKGYRKVTIGGKSVAVHRLVAAAFCPNPEGHAEVNHKNGNKADNRAENLEWCSRSQNMKHAYATGLHPGVSLSGPDNPNFGRSGAKHSQSIPVRATFPDGRIVDYESQGMAEKDGFVASRISLCINGRRKTHGGATWQPLPAAPEVGG